MNKIPQFIILVILILLTGCVLGRRTVDLPIPSLSGGEEAKGEVFIGDITDNRVFQNKPSDPSIPSIDGDVNSLTPQEKAMMIGRQRGRVR